MLESFVGALFLAAVLFGAWQFTPAFGHGRRRLASASAGVAVAYVFIYLLPELNDAGKAFVEGTRELSLPFAEYRVYAAALLGFIAMYGVEHLRKWSRESPEAAGESREARTFRLHIGGFTVYAGLVSFTMTESATRGELPVALYCLAMGLHFVGTAGDLYIEHGRWYLRPGREILAAGVLLGWALGTLIRVPPITFYTLIGLVSGGVVVNSMIMELPRDKDGRFWPFVFGAIGYTLVLLILADPRAGAAGGPGIQLAGAIVDRLLARLSGPMKFRFILQPLMAIALGVRDGRLDAKGGTSQFVIDVLLGSDGRGRLMIAALKRLAMPVALGTVLDAVAQYQMFVHVRMIGALLVGLGVIGIPYVLTRGITNRLTASRHGPPSPSSPS
jgi:hypothetical protein